MFTPDQMKKILSGQKFKEEELLKESGSPDIPDFLKDLLNKK